MTRLEIMAWLKDNIERANQSLAETKDPKLKRILTQNIEKQICELADWDMNKEHPEDTDFVITPNGWMPGEEALKRISKTWNDNPKPIDYDPENFKIGINKSAIHKMESCNMENKMEFKLTKNRGCGSDNNIQPMVLFNESMDNLKIASDFQINTDLFHESKNKKSNKNNAVLCRYERKDERTGAIEYIWRKPENDKDRIFALACIELDIDDDRYDRGYRSETYEKIVADAFNARGINYYTSKNHEVIECIDPVVHSVTDETIEKAVSYARMGRNIKIQCQSFHTTGHMMGKDPTDLENKDGCYQRQIEYFTCKELEKYPEYVLMRSHNEYEQGYGNYVLVHNKRIYKALQKRMTRERTPYAQPVYMPSLDQWWHKYQDAIKAVILIPFKGMPLHIADFNCHGTEDYLEGLEKVCKAHTCAKKYRKEVKEKMKELQEALGQVKASNKGLHYSMYHDLVKRQPWEDFIAKVLPGGEKLIEKAEFRAVKIKEDVDKERAKNKLATQKKMKAETKAARVVEKAYMDILK